MDLEKEKGKTVMKILGRNSSVGGSSRIFYYYGSGEGVPFEWEKKPGIPKHPPKEELPPLSPPPALLSLGLPKPYIAHRNPKPSLATTLRRRFWKTITRKGGNHKKLNLLGRSRNESEDDEEDKDFDVFERFLECNSDFESFASPRDSSFSSSSSSSLSLCRQATRSESLAGEIYGKGRPLGCVPMRFTRILISIMKQR